MYVLQKYIHPPDVSDASSLNKNLCFTELYSSTRRKQLKNLCLTKLYSSTRRKQLKKSMLDKIIFIHQTQTAYTKIYVLQKYIHPQTHAAQTKKRFC